MDDFDEALLGEPNENYHHNNNNKTASSQNPHPLNNNNNTNNNSYPTATAIPYIIPQQGWCPASSTGQYYGVVIQSGASTQQQGISPGITCDLCQKPETDPRSDPIFNPCPCKKVHRSCFKTWRTGWINMRNYWCCVDCGFDYNIERIESDHSLNEEEIKSKIRNKIFMLWVSILFIIAASSTIIATIAWSADKENKSVPIAMKALLTSAMGGFEFKKNQTLIWREEFKRPDVSVAQYYGLLGAVFTAFLVLLISGCAEYTRGKSNHEVQREEERKIEKEERKNKNNSNSSSTTSSGNDKKRYDPSSSSSSRSRGSGSGGGRHYNGGHVYYYSNNSCCFCCDSCCHLCHDFRWNYYQARGCDLCCHNVCFCCENGSERCQGNCDIAGCCDRCIPGGLSCDCCGAGSSVCPNGGCSGSDGCPSTSDLKCGEGGAGQVMAIVAIVLIVVVLVSAVFLIIMYGTKKTIALQQSIAERMEFL